MVFDRLVFRVHAIQRMYQRSVSDEEVRKVVLTGETIEEYPDDLPYPSRLIFGWHGSRPLHVSGSRISKGERNHEVRCMQKR